MARSSDGSSAQGETPDALVTIDAGNYSDRVRLLETLQRAYPLPPEMQDPMAGILIQTEWQQQTGRSGLAWWSQINSALTIWQLQALQQAGILTNIKIEPAPVVRIPSDVAKKVDTYFRLRAQLFADWRSGKLAREELHAAEAHLNELLWDFHLSAVHAAQGQSQSALAGLPEGERRFAESWANLVDILASVNFPTEKAVVEQITPRLPTQYVQPADFDAGKPSRLSPSSRAVVLALDDLRRWARVIPVLSPSELQGLTRTHPRLKALVRDDVEALATLDRDVEHEAIGEARSLLLTILVPLETFVRKP
jgi:hypothetical protein